MAPWWSVRLCAAEKFAVALLESHTFAYAHGGRAVARARLQPGRLDRVFRGLSNAVNFDCFGDLVAPRGGVLFSTEVFFFILINTIEV